MIAVIALIKAKALMTVIALQAEVTQVTASYLSLYMKPWLAKQKPIVELFGDWTKSYSTLPSYMERCALKMRGLSLFAEHRLVMLDQLESYMWEATPMITCSVL